MITSEKFEELLQQFDVTLKRYNPVNYKKLSPPHPRDHVQRILSEVKLSDPLLEVFYSWRNGYHAQFNYPQIIEAFYFLSLESIKEHVQSSDGQIYSQNFIPILIDGGGNDLLFNISKQSTEYGMIFFYFNQGLPEPISYFDNFGTMLQTQIAAYQQGVYKYDAQKNWLDLNDTDYRSLAKQFNPKSKWWTLI